MPGLVDLSDLAAAAAGVAKIVLESMQDLLMRLALFGHELDHLVQRLMHPEQFRKDVGTPAPSGYDNMEEKRVIDGFDAYFSGLRGEGIRNMHRGVNVRTNGVTSLPGEQW